MPTVAVPTLGLDIGGANLKAAHGDGTAVVQPFALWRHPQLLTERLEELFQRLPPARQLAVTLTGELCDCYASRKEGVQAILAAITRASRGGTVHVWQTHGGFASPERAATDWLATASANWSATACFAARFVPRGPGLLLDVGSTTTDFVALADGTWRTSGNRTDATRLRSGELWYAGVGRTPIQAVLTPERLRRHGLPGPLIPEFFATTGDAYLLTGDVEENPDDHHTADGRPRTRAWASNRLLRLLGLDQECASLQLAAALAHAVKAEQLAELKSRLLAANATPCHAFVLAGRGEFLAWQALNELFQSPTIISLGQRLGLEVSHAAAAYAVAVLAGERGGHQP